MLYNLFTNVSKPPVATQYMSKHHEGLLIFKRLIIISFV